MAPKAKEVDYGTQFQFYDFLRKFYLNNKGKIKQSYKKLTKIFLDYNDKSVNPNAWLRKPQFEALEMYVFLKEYLDNKQMSEIFKEWREDSGKFDQAIYFKGSKKQGSGQTTFFDEAAKAGDFDLYYKALEKFRAEYPNYIFSLAMGLGKTLLMATCIFYEFLLAYKFPKDERFCHNALIIAPDLTVLQSLSEILGFDKSRVVPEEYVGILEGNIKTHYLSDSTQLSTLDNSDFNIIISNTQKIIIKKDATEKTPGTKLFTQTRLLENTALDSAISAIFGGEITADNLDVNQRFQKLARLPQLGIYVDEAHHLFGADLEKALRPVKGDDNKNTSLRNTIDLLSEYLKNEKNKEAKLHRPKYDAGIVGCYNFTGTPYVENSVLPEVVYSYGLKESIHNEYLKRVKVNGYENVKDEDFIRAVLTEFWNNYGEKTYEGLNPKLAIFASKIDELVNELKPMVEKILTELGVPISKILVNVGDTSTGKKITSDEELGLFKNLDNPKSPGNDKQIILLVGKGKEGWNCRSLFGVALFRSVKSKVFVLQATMRCLRKITDEQQKAVVFLSKDNFKDLNDELEKNFRVKIEDLEGKKSERKKYPVRVIPPPVELKVKVIHHKYSCEKKAVPDKVMFNLTGQDFSRYEAIKYSKEIGSSNSIKEENVDSLKKNKKFNKYHLVFEISRYLHMKPTEISEMLDSAEEKIEDILSYVNKYNEVLYDLIIPNIFNAIYDVKVEKVKEEKTLVLLREPKDKGWYEFSANPELVIKNSDSEVQKYVSKSFHADTYCFDSKPEYECFLQYLKSSKVKKVYFTGMFTSNQGDFSVSYIDPETRALRKYYPDFLAEMEDGIYQIIEVKGDNMIDNVVVQEKKYAASEMATESHMEYIMYAGSDIMKRNILNEYNFH